MDRSDEEQIRAAKDVLHTCVPWIDSSRLSYSVHRISRAEGKNPGGLRPDGPVLRSFGRVHFVWPTKLALAPVAAAMCVECVRNDAIHQSLEASSEIGVATEPWLKGDVLWN